MVEDLKKKLIQYGDKVLFGIFVVVLLATAAVTVFGGRTPSDSESTTLGEYKPPAETLDVKLAELNQGFRDGGIPSGYMAGGFAEDPHEINPRAGEAVCDGCGWIMPDTVLRCPKCGKWRLNDDDGDGMPNDWEDRFAVVDRLKPDAHEDPDSDGFSNIKEYLGGSDPGDPKSIPSPFRLTKSYRKPVDLRFWGYIVSAGGTEAEIDADYWILQMNYGRGSETALVKLGGRFHGYRLFPLEVQPLVHPADHGIPEWTETEYVLTIQRPNQSPIKLQKEKWARTNETYVDLEVTRGRDSGKRRTGLTVGDTIQANGESFEIIEMRGGKVILRGSEGEIYTLS